MATGSVSAGTGLVNTTRFSHGTLECHDLAASRRFYEEFLGLECVRHGKPPAILVRKGGS